MDVIQDVARITRIVNSYFQNEAKTIQWMNAVQLDNKTAYELIFERRTDELVKWIDSTKDDWVIG